MGIANWSTIEDTIQAQIAAGSGIAGASVRWADQSRDSPASGDSVRLAITNGATVGHAEEHEINNPTPSAGNEILLREHEHLEFDVEVQFFSMTPHGNSSAWARARTTSSYLQRDDVTENLFAAGLALVSVDRVQRAPAVLETEIQDRAVFTARFRTLDGSEQATTYIERAEWIGSLT
jgi:hypothetical protein